MIVAFDFDGTLASSFSLINKCIFKVLEEEGIHMDESSLGPYFGPTEEGMINHILNNENRANFEKYLKYYSEYHNVLLNALNPYCIELLEHLKNKGITLVLLTGRSLESTLISLSYFGLNKYFEKIYVGSKDRGVKKENFKKLMKDFSCTNKDIIYIGDSKKDILDCLALDIKILSINFDNNRLIKLKELNKFCYSNFIDLEQELNKLI